VDDAVAGIAARPGALHCLRWSANCGWDEFQCVCGWFVLPGAQAGECERTIGRFVADGVEDVACAGGVVCRRGVAATKRAGSAAICAAGAGETSGTEDEVGGDAGALRL